MSKSKEEEKKLLLHDVARELVQVFKYITTQEGVVYFFRKNMIWSEASDIALRSQVYHHVRQYYDENLVNKSNTDQIIDLIKQQTTFTGDEIPWWNVKDSEIPFKNGILDVLDNSGKWDYTAPNKLEFFPNLRTFQPDDYLQTYIPHDLPASFPTQIDGIPIEKLSLAPLWKECLDTWFNGDEDKDAKVLALQEFFGYALLPHAKYKKALLCIGIPHTGKTVIQDVLEKMIGTKNCGNLALSRMDDPKEVYRIKGKLLNTIGELSRKGMMSDDGFKRLVSTQESVAIKRLYKDPESYTPITKHAIFTNTLPQIDGRTEEVFDRFLLLKFNNQIPKPSRDPSLKSKLYKEIPGILLWSIDGAYRLLNNNGQFTDVPSAKYVIDEYKKQQNPVCLFIEEHFEEDKESYIPMEQFRKEFLEWYTGPQPTPHKISRWITQAGYQIITKSPTGKKSFKAIKGVRSFSPSGWNK